MKSLLTLTLLLLASVCNGQTRGWHSPLLPLIAGDSYEVQVFNEAIKKINASAFEEAIAVLDDAIFYFREQSTLLAYTYAMRGDVYNRLGRSMGDAGVVHQEKGLQDCSLSIRIDSTNRYGVGLKGKVLIDMGRYAEAIYYLDKDIELGTNTLDAESYNSYVNRGFAKHRLGKKKEAFEDYTVAITIAPEKYLAYMNRAALNVDMGDDDSALVDCEKALELDPMDFDLYLTRGGIRQRRKDYDGSIRDFSRIIAIDSTLVEPFYWRGISNYNLRKDSAAIEDFTKVINLDSLSTNCAGAFFYRGILNVNIGNTDDGLRDYNRAVELDPSFELKD